MAAYELKNSTISIMVDSLGAELKSLKKISTGTEYLWSGDPAFWPRTSPVLFPFVGGLKNNEYRTKGKTYSMTKHGFARDMEFELLSQSEDEIWFVLQSGEETRKHYPYEFILKLGYRLKENQAEVLWKVENPGKETLPFSIGGHPGFRCPIEDGVKQSQCYVSFGEAEEIVSTRISNESGLTTGCMDVYGLNDGRLSLTENLFAHDALVIENHQTGEVSLCRQDGTPYVRVTMEAPLFGVWAPLKKDVPFVCIEPWYGRCDSEDFEGTLEEREWGNIVNPGEVWEASYQIHIL